MGNSDYGDVSHTFIYDTGDDRASDGTTVCFRGGGLNPCSVDTDGDLLPDAWEYQFAGVLFENGTCKVNLSTNDLATITLKDGSQAALSGTEIRGGMDGTWGPYNGPNVNGDPCLDFDHDGLLNCQEYLVQSLRHLRYDDMFTPLMGLDPDTQKFVKFVKFSAWDGETFHKVCLENGFPGLGDWQFGWFGYFTRPPHDWDMLAQNATGKKKCMNYEEAGYRVMLPPHTLVMTMLGLMEVQAAGYATTDPRRWDSDEDGMDDYYELFHGLNPLLGSAVSPLEDGEYGKPNIRFDVIASVYGGAGPNAWFNNWTDWSLDDPPAFDALRYPWMIGAMECDADGDGLRNDEEAIKVNVASPSNTHTDPTPLWMTDSSGRASFTAQYYAFDPYILEKSTGSSLDPYPDILGFPWEELSKFTRIINISWAGATKDWMFAFEENEGFDTDHDFRRDSTELVRNVEDTSDPLLFADLDRRQALYLPGWDDALRVGSAAVSRDGEFRRAISLEPDLLKQFTVECWVKPDGVASNAVIIERICNYGASTLSNSTSVLRANFRVGVDADGRVYGEFEGSTPDSGSARVTGAVLEADVWTHLAFTFDGSAAKLYVNEDRVPVASQAGVGLIPANGVSGIRQEFGSNVMPLNGYVALPCATVLGARLVGESSLTLTENASWNDFSEYFKGWIDEVRIWDGARTADQLQGDTAKRYTFEEVKALRKTVYDAWIKGATRNNADGNENLPAELLQHYNFVSLPGGVTSGNVITEPTGFTRGVLDNVRKPNTESLDEMLVAGWWYRTPVHSTVYWDYHVIPWIGNSVAHLPLMDGSVVDSQYWGLYSAGVMGSYYSDVGKFEFPNSANPYPYYLFRQDRYAHDARLASSEYLGTAVEKGEGGQLDLVSMYRFQLRSDFVGTSDLVPLGGAFARRGTDFWDAAGPMDAWSETKKSAGGLDDSDENGIPDWAESLGYTTAEAYRLALANGLLPDATSQTDYNSDYVSISDVNKNGVADWWEKYFGVFGQSAWSDADHDGLSLLAEYRASTNDVFGTGEMLDPSLPQSDGRNLDYFRVMPNGLYLGEVYADHDFIEDWWEDKYPENQISRNVWDAITDPDRDGWSNFAEARAGTDPTVASVLSIDETELPAYPTPVVEARVSLASGMNVDGTVVVKAWSGSALQGKADATWSIDTRSGSSKEFSRLLGMNPGTTVTPG